MFYCVFVYFLILVILYCIVRHLLLVLYAYMAHGGHPYIMSPVLGLFLTPLPPFHQTSPDARPPPPDDVTNSLHLDLKNIKIAEKTYSFNLET